MWSLLIIVGRFFLVLLAGTIMILPYTLYCKRKKPRIKARKVGPSIRETTMTKSDIVVSQEPLPSALPKVEMDGKSPKEAHKENLSDQKDLKDDNIKGTDHQMKEAKDMNDAILKEEGKECVIYGMNDGKKEPDYENHIETIEPTQASSAMQDTQTSSTMQNTQASTKRLQLTQNSI